LKHHGIKEKNLNTINFFFLKKKISQAGFIFYFLLNYSLKGFGIDLESFSQVQWKFNLLRERIKQESKNLIKEKKRKTKLYRLFTC
jgi:hypothetical protein